MSETPEHRTRREMLARPELVDHLAFNLWKHQTGRWGGMEAAAEWDAMPEEEKAEWRKEVWAHFEERCQQSPAEREMARHVALARTLAINDAEFAPADPARPAPEGAATPEATP